MDFDQVAAPSSFYSQICNHPQSAPADKTPISSLSSSKVSISRRDRSHLEVKNSQVW